MASIAETEGVSRLVAQYFELVDLRNLTIPSSTVLKNPVTQNRIYNEMFNEDLLTPVIPPAAYRLRLLKKLIAVIENNDQWDPEEDEIIVPLMTAMIDLMSQPMQEDSSISSLDSEEPQLSFVSYTVPQDGHQERKQITTFESRGLIYGSGSTGFRTWEAALHLGTYLSSLSSVGSSSSPVSVRGKKVVELGAGTGFLSLLCQRLLGAERVLMTDGNAKLVDVFNGPCLEQNGFIKGKDAIEGMQWLWGEPLPTDETEEQFDIAFGADVTYDITIIPLLVDAISRLFSSHGVKKFVIAATIRNEETFGAFLDACLYHHFIMEKSSFESPVFENQTGFFHSTQCDLLRPHCTPCLRKGRPCPGYRDEVDVLFRTNTFSAYQSSYQTNKGRDRERRTKKSSLSKSGDLSSDSSSSSTGDSSSIGDGDSTERKEYDNTSHLIAQDEGYSSLTAYIPFRIPGTRRDQQLLHYYCATTSQALSQYPKTGFWTSTVLQWSAHEPVIRRCMIAYSCSHHQYNPSRGCSSSDFRGITSGGISDHDYSLQIMPLLEYNNALRLLRQYIVTALVPQSSREVILISIAILYVAARSIGKLEDAKTHLRAASEILNSWMKSEQRSGQVSHSSGGLAPLLEIFSKISLQATLFDDMLPSSYLNDSETEYTTTMIFGPMIANQFQNAIEAQHALETVQSRFFRFIVVNRKPDCHAPPPSLPVTTTDENNHFPPFVYTEITTLEKQVAFWRSSFRDILGTSSYIQPSGARGPVRYHTALLYAQHWTLSTLVRSSMQLLNGRQPSSPELNAHAGRVLSLLKTNFIFPTPQADTKEEAQLEKIICKPSATPQLYLELAQQRDFAMQSKAIELLTNTLNHEDMANVLRILNLLMAIGRKESHPFYNSQDHTKDLVAAQRELERLVQVLDERKD